jgi:ribonuclease P protein component
MLAKSLRLPSRTRVREFQLYRNPLFFVKIGKNDLPSSRFGFIISKKTAKSAVARNKSRRKLRSGIELLIEDIAPGYDFLFVMTKNLTKELTAALQTQVKELLKSKGLLI